MRAFRIICLLVISCSMLNGQTDSIRSMINRAPDPRIVVIMKERQLVLNKLVEGDKALVKDLVNYMIERENDSIYVALYPHEKILLWIWAEDYGKVISEVAVSDPSQERRNNWRKIPPPYDELAMKLERIMFDRRNSVRESLLSSSQKESDRLLMELVFE